MSDFWKGACLSYGLVAGLLIVIALWLLACRSVPLTDAVKTGSWFGVMTSVAVLLAAFFTTFAVLIAKGKL